ncbi:MAG: FAD-dependent oxidoreductase, partial [Acutalibacteraceae bacterium]
KVFGQDRLTAVEISKVDEKMNPIEGTQQIVECDALILSVGLIPENELAESLSVKLDPRTKGPVVNNSLMTTADGVFSCGNALHVNDLVDYVSESGETAGKNAAKYSKSERNEIDIHACDKFLYVVPQKLDLNQLGDETVIYFRSRDILDKCQFKIKKDGQEVFSKKYQFLRPPEMEKLVIDFSSYGLSKDSKIEFEIEVKAE